MEGESVSWGEEGSEAGDGSLMGELERGWVRFFVVYDLGCTCLFGEEGLAPGFEDVG